MHTIGPDRGPGERSSRAGILEQPEAHIRAVLDASLDALITIDEHGRIVEFNRGAERIFEYAREDVLGREMAEVIVPPALREPHRRGMARYLATGEAAILGRRLEIVGMRSDGSEFPVELTVTRVPIEGVVLFTGALRDITDRKRREARQQAQYAVTRILSEASSLDEAGPRILEAASRGLGWEVGQIWSLPEEGGALRCVAGWSSLSEKSREFEAMSRALRFERGTGLPGRVWDAGEPAWLNDVLEDANFPRATAARAAGLHAALGAPIRSGGGIRGVIEFFATDRRIGDEDLIHLVDALGRQLGDFVERKKAESAIRESEARYRRILETTNEGIWWIDADARTVYVNERLAEMLGRTVAEIQDQSVFDFLDPDERDRVRQMLARRRQGLADQFDVLFRKKDGAAFWAIVSSTPVTAPDGEFAGALAMLTDITERRRAADADQFLLEAAGIFGSSLDEARTLQSLADLAVPRVADWCQVELVGEDERLAVVAVAHRDPAKVDAARRLREEYPAPLDQPAGGPEVVRTGKSEMISQIADAILVSRARSPEHLGLMRSLGLASYLCVPISARGRTLGALTLATAESRRPFDATDLRLAERIGSLAAMAVENARLYRDARQAVQLRDDFLSIAGHELRTPLSALSLQIQMLSRAGAGTSPAASLDRLRRSVDRLSRLVDDLLDVSRLSADRLALEPQEVDLAALTKEVLERLAAEAESTGSPLELRAGDPIVGLWDPRRIDQVIQNLLSNAIKYGQGRPIRIELSGDSEVARIEVRDAGIGIDEQDQARIFGRFERAVSGAHIGGLGLGLWITRGIVEASGGDISVESAPGKGSTFTVRLPRRGPPAPSS